MLSVLLNHSPLYPFKQGLSLSLSLKLVLPDSAALPNQQPPGILVSKAGNSQAMDSVNVAKASMKKFGELEMEKCYK